MMGFLIDMVAVGYGDAFLLSIDDPVMVDGQRYVLVDGGPGGDEGTQRLAKHIREYAAGRIDVVICTHADSDHIRGIVRLASDYGIPIAQLAVNTPPDFGEEAILRKTASGLARLYGRVGAVPELSKAISDLADLVSRFEDGNIVAPVAGSYWRFGDTMLTVLSPSQNLLDLWYADLDSGIAGEIDALEKAVSSDNFAALVGALAEAKQTTPVNNASVVFEISDVDGPYALFTGDAGCDTIRDCTGGKRYQFLKVPHHGSESGIDEELARQLRPRTAFVSVGPNSYGHPNESVLELVTAQGGRVFCSEKLETCASTCDRDWGDVICQPHLRRSRRAWSTLDVTQCPYNQ